MSTVDEIVEFVGEVLEKRFVEIDPNAVERGFFMPFDGYGLRIDISEQTDDYLKSYAAEMDIPADVTVKLMLFICREIEPTPEFFEYATLELPTLTDYMPWIFETDDSENLSLGCFCVLPGDTLNEYLLLLTIEALLQDGLRVGEAVVSQFDAVWQFDMDEDE